METLLTNYKIWIIMIKRNIFHFCFSMNRASTLFRHFSLSFMTDYIFVLQLRTMSSSRIHDLGNVFVFIRLVSAFWIWHADHYTQHTTQEVTDFRKSNCFSVILNNAYIKKNFFLKCAYVFFVLKAKSCQRTFHKCYDPLHPTHTLWKAKKRKTAL